MSIIIVIASSLSLNIKRVGLIDDDDGNEDGGLRSLRNPSRRTLLSFALLFLFLRLARFYIIHGDIQKDTQSNDDTC